MEMKISLPVRYTHRFHERLQDDLLQVFLALLEQWAIMNRRVQLSDLQQPWPFASNPDSELRSIPANHPQRLQI